MNGVTHAVETILDRLDNVRRSGAGWTARCPGHHDRHNSLSIGTGDDGRTLLHCHARCDLETILDTLGLTAADLFVATGPPPHASRHGRTPGTSGHRSTELGPIVATYVYSDRFRVTRHDPKTFRPWHREPGGAWRIGAGAALAPLYHEAELLAADPARWVFKVEGEKDADALRALGCVATTNVGGAGKWHERYAEALRGRKVAILPDNDDAGRKHAEHVAASLAGVAAEVRIVTLPGLPEKGDVSDYIGAGHGVDELRRVVRAAPAWQPADAPGAEDASERKLRFRTAREIGETTPEETDHIAEPYLVAGGITELDGKAKAAGKTTWAMAMCAAILDGADFMGYPTKPSPVVYLSEQAPASLRQSLRRAGLLGRPDFLVLGWHDTIGTDWPTIVAAAVAEARRIGARVLVVDTLPQFAGLRGDAENNAGEALFAVQPLQAAAAEGLAVLMLRHERKSGGDVGDSGRGSSAFAGAVDIVLSLRRAEGAARPTIRHVHALSRFDETPDLLVIELTPAGYVALGTETAVAEAEARDRTLAAAPESEPAAMTEVGLLTAADVKRTIGRGAIAAHLEAGRLRRTGEGKRGDPFRYWRPTNPDSAKVSDVTTGEPSESTTNDVSTSEKVSDATSSPREAQTNRLDDATDPVLAETVRHFLSLSENERAAYRNAVAAAGDDDPFAEHDRAALALADQMHSRAAP